MSSELAGWQNFYVIVGSSAGALIGLQFVVMALIADMPIRPGMPQAASAFATPTIVHFAAVLLLSAVLSVPWPGVGAAAAAWGVLGLVGVIYAAIVGRRMLGQRAYRPDSEDWSFHVVLPFAAYTILVVSAYATRWHSREALFGVGAAVLLLLFIGIHNAWDAATYHVFVTRGRKQEAERVAETTAQR